MSDDLRKQIYKNLSQKETDDLIGIWQTNDRVEWTELAFDVVREILQERLGELPLQNEPMLEHIKISSIDEFDDDESLEILTNKDNAPVFYKPQEVLWLEKWVNRAAIASIVASVFANILILPQMQRIASFYFQGNVEWSVASWLIAIIEFVFSVSLQAILIYFPLKALGSVLKILMAMEFNSRGVKQNRA